VSHANAALTPIQRRRIGRLVIDDGASISHAAAVFNVSWPTAKRWADRYQQAAQLADGPVRAADLADRSSRPHTSPTRTPQPVVRKIVHLRWRATSTATRSSARLSCTR
jgi:transposase-like protein